ncbi:MAG: GNAT family N-acetyltransferase [Eubacteriales bacterium]|nr:GNAT family N-acetyltransferase [Eubacteriales bacterium]
MVQGKWFPMGAEISEPLAVRQQVFGRQRDALDSSAQQVVVYKENRPVGAGRLWWSEGAFMLGEVGVLESERGQGFGDLLVRLLLFKALTHSAGTIQLDAPKAIAPFFARYGFAPLQESGDVLRMSIAGKDVQLSHCGGNCAECAHPSEECVPKALR